MPTIQVEELYERHIRTRPAAEQLRLVSLLVTNLQAPSAGTEAPRRSIMEFHGLGRDLWAGVDAQEYVDNLRREWDERP
jgi:hypothetical protein